MRVMVLVKGDERYEQGQMPATDELDAMGKFNEELVKAGVMLAGEGLHPTSRAKRVRFNGPSERKVIDGPFTETKELLAGYWLWQVKDMDEAVEWLKRAPFQEGDVDLRPVFEEDDFGEELTPELRERERRLREQTEQNQ
ncbi:MAG: YciI family protein [Actinomycetota bacterium]|nr:YciI family protein [Actinomycetota bacterium]